MTSTDVRTASSTAESPMPGTVDMKLEVVVLPVSDADRAKALLPESGLAPGCRISPSATIFGCCSLRPPGRRPRSSSAPASAMPRPDRQRAAPGRAGHRGGARRSRRSRRERERGVPRSRLPGRCGWPPTRAGPGTSLVLLICHVQRSGWQRLDAAGDYAAPAWPLTEGLQPWTWRHWRTSCTKPPNITTPTKKRIPGTTGGTGTHPICTLASTAARLSRPPPRRDATWRNSAMWFRAEVQRWQVS